LRGRRKEGRRKRKNLKEEGPSTKTRNTTNRGENQKKISEEYQEKEFLTRGKGARGEKKVKRRKRNTPRESILSFFRLFRGRVQLEICGRDYLERRDQREGRVRGEHREREEKGEDGCPHVCCGGRE